MLPKFPIATACSSCKIPDLSSSYLNLSVSKATKLSTEILQFATNSETQNFSVLCLKPLLVSTPRSAPYQEGGERSLGNLFQLNALFSFLQRNAVCNFSLIIDKQRHTENVLSEYTQ
jgi:hypothetical protein